MEMNLYRNALKALDWGDGALVIGHKSPDCDSAMAALAYAKLMQSLGFNAQAKLAGKPNNETVYAAKSFGIELPEILTSASSCDLARKSCEPVRLILVDHSDYAQAVDGARDARIIQVLDHHGLGDIMESKLLYAKYMPVGSTCSIVYTSYKELDVEITSDVANILMAGLLSDTLNLVKVTTTDVDRQIYKDLIELLAKFWNIDVSAASAKIADIYNGMVEAAHDFSSMTDEEIFNSDAKDYVIGGIKFRLGSLDCRDASTIEEFSDRMLNAMASVTKSTGCTLCFCRVGFEEHTHMLYCGADKASERFAKAIAERAFGESKRPGIIYCERRLSRKLDVIPMLTAALSK